MSQCAQGNADRVGRRLRAYRLTRGEKTGMNTAQVHAVSRSGGGVPHEMLVCSQEPPHTAASARRRGQHAECRANVCRTAQQRHYASARLAPSARDSRQRPCDGEECLGPNPALPGELNRGATLRRGRAGLVA